MAQLQQEYAALLQLSLNRPSQPADGLAGWALAQDLAAIAASLARCRAVADDAVLARGEAVLRGEVARVAAWVAEVAHGQAWITQIEAVLTGGVLARVAEAGSGQAEMERRLEEVLAAIREEGALTEWEGELREHILGVSERYRSGVVVCYEVAGVPRTNNALEGLFGQMRQRARRQTGYKQVGRVLQRHGAWLVYEKDGTIAEVAAELSAVDEQEYQQERARWEARQARFRRRYRWQRNRGAVLADLEAQWSTLGASSTL